MSGRTVVAQFEYKCRRCNEVVNGAVTSIKNGPVTLVGVVTEVRPEGTLSMVSIHRCDIGGEGVTDLIGYRLDLQP